MSMTSTIHYESKNKTSIANLLSFLFPYCRHKVLTNGSFLNLNLKEGPLASSGSDDASNSSRPTTSTEDPNSDSENNKAAINLRRSKSTMHRHNQPDLLPPPDGFDNTIPRHSSSSSSAYHQHNSGSHHTMQSSAYPIDTNTAKAIIDTYSGHLFSRSTNYYSFRGDSSNHIQHPSSAVEKLFTRDPTNMDQDSLDHQQANNSGNSPSNYYQHSVLVPPNSGNSSATATSNSGGVGPRVKTRTESVV